MEDIELLRLEKRRRKAKLKFFGLDVPNHPDFNQEGLADGFDVNNSCYPSMLVKSTWGDDYDIALYGENAADDHWDDKAVDDFYKDAIPKWSSDEELARGKKNYYVVQESELQENDWLYLFTEIAFYSKTNNVLTAPPPLEIKKVVVVTKEDTEEGHEKLKAHNAIYYVSYKYNGESSEWARDHKAVIRKTMDGKPGHMYLEVVAAD
ncbi:hypothetical protein F2Q70_00034290 [Brassica cretica]|uniref:Uncharacterized protein n=1 Tax=Brassica cretica TaxID=69181 RepID=A0A8S9JVH1_BRACR|nr:hypothetical protein F2Q70_00034290 [Brassica cretica]